MASQLYHSATILHSTLLYYFGSNINNLHWFAHGLAVEDSMMHGHDLSPSNQISFGDNCLFLFVWSQQHDKRNYIKKKNSDLDSRQLT